MDDCPVLPGTGSTLTDFLLIAAISCILSYTLQNSAGSSTTVATLTGVAVP